MPKGANDDVAAAALVKLSLGATVANSVLRVGGQVKLRVSNEGLVERGDMIDVLK